MPLTKFERARHLTDQADVRQTRDHLLEHDADLGAGEEVAEAQVRAALAEGDVSLSARVMSKSYGLPKTSSSRLPEAYHMTTLSPSLTCLPPSSTSRVAVRRKW